MSHSDVSSIMKGQVPGTDFWRMVNRSWQIWPKAISLHLSNAKFTVSSCLMYLTNNGKLAVLFNWITMNAIHFLCETFRVYSLVDPCCLQDLMLLAMLGSVSGQCRLSTGLLPGYKRVSKWPLQHHDSHFPLLSQRMNTAIQWWYG